MPTKVKQHRERLQKAMFELIDNEFRAWLDAEHKPLTDESFGEYAAEMDGMNGLSAAQVVAILRGGRP